MSAVISNNTPDNLFKSIVDFLKIRKYFYYIESSNNSVTEDKTIKLNVIYAIAYKVKDKDLYVLGYTKYKQTSSSTREIKCYKVLGRFNIYGGLEFIYSDKIINNNFYLPSYWSLNYDNAMAFDITIESIVSILNKVIENEDFDMHPWININNK